MDNWALLFLFYKGIKNGSREGKEFINFLGQGHIRRGHAPIGPCAKEAFILPHSCPVGSLEHKMQSTAPTKPLSDSSLEQTQSRFGTKAQSQELSITILCLSWLPCFCVLRESVGAKRE